MGTLRQLVGGDQRRPATTRSREILAQGPLATAKLEIPYAGIVENRVTRHMAQGVFRRQRPARLADDDRQFPFIVQLGGNQRDLQGLPMTHQRIAKPNEKIGETRRRQGCFHGMAMVIQSGAKDFSPRHGR